jgi:adenosylmethionine-8-amino-7-oxononanoate aminotransferase
MAAVILDGAALEDDPSMAKRFWRAARARGVLTRGLGNGVAIAPPLIVTDEQQQLILEGLEAALGDVSARTAPAASPVG